MSFQDPFLQPGLIVLQREVPVFGFLLNRDGVAEGAARVDELLGAEAGAASLALIAVCILIAANGAGTYDVTVGEE